jgi:hypothetical protein
MTIKQLVYGALAAILPEGQVHAVELSDDPVWPALVFEIDTTPEQTWVQGGGYNQHAVAVVTLAKTLADIAALRPQVLAAMEAIPGYMFDEDEGDAEFEGDASVYAYVQNFRLRSRKY